MTGFTLTDLERALAARACASPEESYTARLVADPQRAAKKFGEEAVEAVIAGATGDRAALVSESADVLYHLLALLLARGVPLDEVMAELEGRTGRSGLAEKAARTREGVRAPQVNPSSQGGRS
ncbi:phosphoribosyl-ATP diphosphatase [Salinarimonas ramus]|nr:phosphoribosyl-ATP diphosphatase [Salinarimonas ramus]